VSVISIEDVSIGLRLTTFVPSMEDPQSVLDQGNEPMWEHNLHVKISKERMKIEDAKVRILAHFVT
jgi:hypothetical protein